MADSATTTRERRRQQTTHRITVCAQRLTEEHGLDGFTMDDLARAAEVSRRTLFNYFPSKLDAVLGAAPDIDAEVLATFVAGGPHGRLFDDLGALARSLLDVKELDRESLELGRRVLVTTPRLLAAAHERFEQLTAEFAEIILDREGRCFGLPRARLAVRMMVATFDTSLSSFLDDPRDRPIAAVFDDTLRDALELLA
ncbi:MAG: Bacterial regulatory protein tetR family [Nocardioides sp.]|nr:Bacterial regulatory protein tetR family [Nocardioides sp.]